VRPIDVREPIPDRQIHFVHQPDGGQSDPAIVGGVRYVGRREVARSHKKLGNLAEFRFFLIRLLSEFAFCLAFCCKFLTKMRTDESEHQISTCVAIEYGDAHRKRFTVDDHREDPSEGFTVDGGWPHVKTCVCS
jgi:hypothetical protein